MHLHAAFIPPASVRQALFDLLTAQEPVPQPPVAVETPRGLFRRKGTPEPEEEVPTGPLLDLVPVDSLVLPITDFGYLNAEDARRLGDAVERACAELPRGPSVRVSGGSALIDPDDRSVWAELEVTDDDLAALRTIARTVVSSVEPLGFFCDRRRFRPRLAVATINDATTVEHLEQVLGALSDYQSAPWKMAEVDVLQRGAGVWRTVMVGG